MNSHIWDVFRYELRRNIGRKGFLFATFGLPLIGALLLFGYRALDLDASSFGSDNESDLPPGINMPFDEGVQGTGYVDLSGLFDEAAVNVQRYPDEASALAAINANEIDVYYVIAEDYLETGDITIAMPGFSFAALDTDPIRDLILNTFGQDADLDVMARLRDPSNIREVNLERGFEGDNQQNMFNTMQSTGGAFLLVYAFAITLTISALTTNGYLMQSVIEEKETRLIEILISSVRPLQLLVGKILALGLLGLLQIVTWLATMFLLARLAISLDVGAAMLSSINIPLHILPIILVYFLLAYLMFATVFGAVGALSTSMQEGPQFAAILTVPAMIPLYFTFVFVETPDAALPTILSLIPPMSPMAMVLRLAVSEVPAWQVIISLLLLVLTIIGLMRLAGRLFRVHTLLAGQRPRLRDIPRLIRG